MVKNGKKYPADKAKGSALKYTVYEKKNNEEAAGDAEESTTGSS